MNYREALKQAMTSLAEDRNTIFIGQTVEYKGTVMAESLTHIPARQRIELPVIENCQMGFCIGLALEGYLPVSVYPRWNFLLLAADQIVNHLDKLSRMSDGGYRPKVIIRTCAASAGQLDPGPQHLGDFSSAFRLMAPTIQIFQPRDPIEVIDDYATAQEMEGSSIVVESGECY